MALSTNGTQGRVYGGDPDLIHIADGNRANVGRWLADQLDARMRADAIARGIPEPCAEDDALCPGCYMVAGFDMLVALARKSGQPLTELARSMAHAFEKLAENGFADAAFIEEIEVLLDPENVEEGMAYAG